MTSKGYVSYNIHDLPALLPSTNFCKDDYWAAVYIDPAIKNCAIRVVHYEKKQILTKLQLSLDFSLGSKPYMLNVWPMLDKYLPYFQWSHYIVIEAQPAIASAAVLKISQHITSYFLERTKNVGYRPLLIEISPKLKSKGLNAPKFKSKLELKKWCHAAAIDILRERKDYDTMQLIMNDKKFDNSDTVCYDEVWRCMDKA